MFCYYSRLFHAEGLFPFNIITASFCQHAVIVARGTAVLFLDRKLVLVNTKKNVLHNLIREKYNHVSQTIYLFIS